MSEVVVDTLRISQVCTIGGNVQESKRVYYNRPCTQAKVRGRFTVTNCGISGACTRLKYLIDGQEVFSRQVEVGVGGSPVRVEFEITLRCSEIQGKTHTLYAEGCFFLSAWNVDAQAEVVAVVETTPTPTPTSTPPGPITDSWILAMIMAAVIMAAALVAVALIVRR
ncbi:MAG: hypothetical protein ACO2PN_29320 [Pyrobaculum sp.]|jgi:hypothetical protein